LEIPIKAGLSSQDPDVTLLQLGIAVADSEMGEYDKSLELLRAIFPTLKRNEGKHFSVMQVVEAEQLFATALQSLNKNQETVEIIQKSYEKLLKSTDAGPHHFRTVDVLHSLADSLCKLGRIEEAKKAAQLVKSAWQANQQKVRVDAFWTKIS